MQPNRRGARAGHRDQTSRASQSARAVDERILGALSVLACAPQPFALTVFARAATAGARRWAAAKALFIKWWHRHRSRRELLQLDVIELSDIAITRTDAVIEASKPLWGQMASDPTLVRSHRRIAWLRRATMTIEAIKLDSKRADFAPKLGRRNPWWIVVASTIGLTVGQASIAQFCFGIFLKPVSDDLNLSRGALSLSLLLTNLSCALAAPIVGILIDRYGARMVMLPGTIAYAASVAALAALQPTPLALVYALFLVVGLFSAVQSTSAYATVVCKWFDRERGLALGLTTAGIGLGVLIVPQLADLAIRDFGWRTAYLVLSAMIIIFAFVPVALFVREPPEARRSQQKLAGAARLPGLTIAQALTRSWRFWCLGVAFFVGGMAIQGTLVHAVAMLTDRGFDVRAASAVFSSTGLAIIAGRVACGYCLDRFDGPRIAIGSFVVPMVGVALLASGLSGAFPALGILFCGLGIGAQIGLQPFFVSRYFGLNSIGAVSGMIFGLFLVGAGLGPYLSGLCFDLRHTYVPALVAYVIALGMSSLLFAPLGAYPFADGSTGKAVSPLVSNDCVEDQDER